MDEQGEFVEEDEEMDAEGQPDPEEESNDRLVEDPEATGGFQGGEEAEDEHEEQEAAQEGDGLD